MGRQRSLYRLRACSALVATMTYRPMFLMIAIAYPLGLLAAFLATTGRSMLDREIAA